MNFLPIPALDGGHVVFLTWEIVTGKKPSDTFLENAQKVGMIVALGIDELRHPQRHHQVILNSFAHYELEPFIFPALLLCRFETLPFY